MHKLQTERQYNGHIIRKKKCTECIVSIDYDEFIVKYKHSFSLSTCFEFAKRHTRLYRNDSIFGEVRAFCGADRERERCSRNVDQFGWQHFLYTYVGKSCRFDIPELVRHIDLNDILLASA